MSKHTPRVAFSDDAEKASTQTARELEGSMLRLGARLGMKWKDAHEVLARAAWESGYDTAIEARTTEEKLAPELLHALRGMLDAAPTGCDCGACQCARTTIAKAEGES